MTLKLIKCSLAVMSSFKRTYFPSIHSLSTPILSQIFPPYPIVPDDSCHLPINHDLSQQRTTCRAEHTPIIPEISPVVPASPSSVTSHSSTEHSAPPMPRRSSRISKPPTRLQDYACCITSHHAPLYPLF